MELEKLNKSQIVLLTLLVSFVTSIATGIVTVSLLEQAPPAITQTVNRIVERTVERVAPSQAAAAASSAPAEPVIVSEPELLAQAVARVAPSVVRLFAPGKDEDGKDVQLFVGLGIVVDASGIIIADAGTPDGELTALRPDNIEVMITIIGRPKDANMIRLQAATTTGEKQEPLAWKPVELSEDFPALGERVVTIAGRTAPRVAQGIVIAVPEMKEGALLIVETDIVGDQFAAGSPLITPNGGIIGIATRQSRAAAGGGFLASPAIVLDNKAPAEEKPATSQ